MYNNHDPNQPNTASKRNSISTQARLPNGQFARTFQQKRETDNKMQMPSSVPYQSHDHQYQKPLPTNYGGFSPQRPMHHYQQNYNYQQGYTNNHLIAQQPQGYASPNNPYHSPQQNVQPSHEISSTVPTGFQSPTYSNQVVYHQPPVTSPSHMVSPQQSYGRPEFHYNQNERHGYTNQHQSAIFQSPPHQTQYQNPIYYQRTSQVAAQSPQYNQQNYHNMPNQYNSPNVYQNQNQNTSSTNYNVHSPYRQPPKAENNQVYGNQQNVSNNQQFQIYQSPQPNNNFRNNSIHDANVAQNAYSDATARQDTDTSMKNHERVEDDKNTTNNSNTQKSQHKSPNSSVLRNVRHDQPNVKVGQKSPDIGFSNQFLNFISNRNEPKDNANTPKFTNSPSISQKMHKNLYVSSPEQAQVPPSSGLSDTDSKDGMTAQTATPIQSAKISHSIEKHKDISKRQLDFEHRTDVHSEDSRDSVGKESRISSVYSRQSDFHSDGYGMDVDSENSMECANFKSSHSISLVETSDIPRPADIDFPKVIDPFNKKMLTSLLEYVKFPNKTHADGYIEVRSVPKLQVATVMSVGNTKFSIEKQLGKGNYGAVFLCLDLHSNKSVAVKYQKPSRPWEFYICQEIKARIKDPFMVI